MLILTRKLGQTIRIGNEIKITVSDIKGKQIRLGIEAPENMAVHREEVYQIIQKENILAAELDMALESNLPNLLGQLVKKEEEK
ncbi:MAG: carbon storage regulator CsrA [Deltaproteobacteria bacterium]|nr:carbon storage regulator CsrA [Deltaproteobacteria bacterium]